MTKAFDKTIASKVDTFASDIVRGGDVWPAFFRFACEQAQNGKLDLTNRAKSGNKIVDDAADLLADLRGKVDTLASKSEFKSVKITDKTAEARGSNIRTAIKLGKLEGINGVSLLSSTLAIRSGVNNPKTALDAFVSVASKQLANKGKPLTEEEIRTAVTVKPKTDTKPSDLEVLFGLVERVQSFYTATDKTKPHDEADGHDERAKFVAKLRKSLEVAVKKAKLAAERAKLESEADKLAKEDAAEKAAAKVAAAKRKVPTKRGK